MSSISHEDASPDLRRIFISCRLDNPGNDSIAEQLVELTATSKKSVVVDLSDVKFLASIGIRSLIMCAKTVVARGGNMTLVVDPGSTVMMSLEATGIDDLVPTFSKAAEAEKAALA